jgi:nicotinamidase-related amidase
MEGNCPKQVALLIVDMQNDFVRRGAPLPANTIAPHRALLQAFRPRGWPVVCTRFLSRQEPNLLWNWYWRRKAPT